ncbi:hypothetical protein PMAYCL1PPCAC_04936, partial [Pristionchus mayeri]
QRSPVPIDTVIADPGYSWQDALLFDYDNGSAIGFKEDKGHWEVRLNGNHKIYVKHLNATFVLEQIHVHWGNSVDEPGSEHVLSGNRSTAEIHLVHRNVRYSSVWACLGVPAGVLVVGVLIDAVDDDDSTRDLADKFRTEGQLSVLADLLKQENRNLRDHHLQKIFQNEITFVLPENSPFSHYSGSLTTNAKGPVEWIVFETPIRVKREALAFAYKYGPANWNQLHTIRNDTVIYRPRPDLPAAESGS